MWKRYKTSLGYFLFLSIILSPCIGIKLHGFTVTFEKERLLYFLSLFFCFSLIAPWLTFPFQLLKKIPFPTTFRFTKLLPLLGILSLMLPFLSNQYWLSIATLCCIYILLGLGLNIIVGLAGLLNLGFAAFFAIGAYTYALTAQYFDLSFWQALPLALLSSACFGALLVVPLLRLQGDYLAIVTLAFGEIIRLVLTNWQNITGGANGILVPFPTCFHLTFSRVGTSTHIPFHEYFSLPYHPLYRFYFIYYIVLFFTIAGILFFIRLRNTRLGQRFEALKEDEIACRSLGLNPSVLKFLAFTISAALGGLGGCLFAAFEGFITPDSFSFIESAFILSIVVLGGMGSALGTIVAAITLTLIPEILRDFSECRMLFFGTLMVGMMIGRPNGLFQSKRKHFFLTKSHYAKHTPHR